MSVATQVKYDCEVREVFSGDDLVVMVDLGVENLWKRQRVRLAGVDTPNAVNAREDTQAGEIRREVRALARNKKGQLTIVSRNSNSWVVQLTVTTPVGPVDVNKMLIDKGYEFKASKRPENA